jgi:hypothetical protein
MPVLRNSLEEFEWKVARYVKLYLQTGFSQCTWNVLRNLRDTSDIVSDLLGALTCDESVINVLADREVCHSVLAMKSLNQTIPPLLNENGPDLWDILTLFQTIHHFEGWDTAYSHIFKTTIEPFRVNQNYSFNRAFSENSESFQRICIVWKRRWSATCTNHGGGVSGRHIINILL